MRSACVLLLFAACGGSKEQSGDRSPASLKDTNPASDVAEFTVVASEAQAAPLPGKTTSVWAYRDGSDPGASASVPGPLLDVNQGDHVIVHLRNELPSPTTIHWHGLRVPNASDGTPTAQAAVPPGGSFDYEFDATDAGFFWFHPHIQSDVQIERGLYAPLVVRSRSEPEVTAERVLVLDDVKIESNGALSTTTEALDVMLGRQGNVLLVNGARKPSYEARAGARERWRIVNVANGRYFNLSLPGHSFRVIGWDGGRIPHSYLTDTLLITPGERYDVLVDLAGKPGDRRLLQTVHYDRGHEIPDPGPLDLLELELGAALDVPPSEFVDDAPDYAAIAVDETTPVEQLVLSESEDGAEPSFFINAERFPEITPLSGRPEQVAVWEITNDAEMDHPFHLHGMFFQALTLNDVPFEHEGLKDTLNIPMKQTARVAIRYGSPGAWMFHCHILEHAERGMMGELMLEPE